MAITECLVRLHPLDSAPVELARRVLSGNRRFRGATLRRRHELAEVFTQRELITRIVRPSRLRLVQPLHAEVSAESRENLTELLPDGRLVSRTGQKFPLILMQKSRSVFTSVCLVLHKPPR